MKAHMLAMALVVAGCTVQDPLYCDEKRECTDPDRSYCDLYGEYPASGGIARTCIADPLVGEIDSGPSPADAATLGPDASAEPDGGAACTWTRLVKLAGINSSKTSEFVGSLNAEGTVVYFKRNGTPETDGLFMSSRTRGQAFGDLVPLVGLGGDETYRTSPEVSSTGLEIVFGIEGGTLVGATRDSVETAFEPAEPIGVQGGSPSFSGDGLALYYVRQGDVFRSTRAGVGQPWDDEERILPTTGFTSIDVSPDERRLLLLVSPFDPSPVPLFVTTRASTDASFSAPTPLNDGILADGGSLYNSARWNGPGDEMIVSLTVDSEVDMYYAACQ